MKLFLYAVRHFPVPDPDIPLDNFDDSPWLGSPFVAVDDTSACSMVERSLYELVKDSPDEFSLDCSDELVSIGTFDPNEQRVRGISEPRVVCSIPDCVSDLKERLKEIVNE